ncbi:MAG: SLC13 family permease [Bacteroidota bacterium]
MDFLLTDIIHEVSSGVTYLHLGILVAMVLALALEEKLHANKSLITGIAAIVALIVGELTGVLSIFGGQEGHVPFYIEFIDWGVIAIILGSSLFVEVTTKSGIFSWLAIRLTKLTKGDPFRLLMAYSWMTVIFSAFLNNVTAMIIVGSLTVVSLEKLDKRYMLLGFLLTEGLLTNIGGLLTLISSVPNIIIGNAAKISFVEFVYISAPYVVIATLLTIYAARIFFNIKGLKQESEKAKAAKLIAAFDENDGIESRAFFVLSWVVFGAFILALATTDIIPYIQELGIGFVAMAFGVLMLLRVKSATQKVYSQTDWDLIFFFAFLFIVIGVMEYAQVLELIGGLVTSLLDLGDIWGPQALLWASAVASSVTDNIPLAAMLAKTLEPLGASGELTTNTWWALIYGANLGGNITPIGSASTVVAVTIIARNKLKLGFIGFVVKAIPFALIHLVLASIYVWILGSVL